LLQVVDNLLNNAIQHSPPGTLVRIVVRGNGHATIEVVDDGPGLPPGFQAHAFERFHRAEKARSRESGGTGLGLSIVRAIVEAHGGTADIVNRPEGGARATVRLPLIAPSQLAEDFGETERRLARSRGR
jgi:two-component system OmpR family sensor kinase